MEETSKPLIPLPNAQTDGGAPLAHALATRRTQREFARRALRCDQFAQLLWAAQGVTHSDGRRTAPSAGALFPLELYAIVSRVEQLTAGVYHYRPHAHALASVTAGPRLTVLADLAVGQEWIARAAAVLVLTAVEARITGKYGARGVRYAQIEVGHAAQNVLLQAAALDLAAAVVGAFDDAALIHVLRLPPGEVPLYLLPVGHKA